MASDHRHRALCKRPSAQQKSPSAFSAILIADPGLVVTGSRLIILNMQAEARMTAQPQSDLSLAQRRVSDFVDLSGIPHKRPECE